MNNPIKSLTRREWCLWLASLAVVLIANQITPELDPLTMTAALVGVTSLVFAAKGNVWSQVLMIVFSILYGVISFRFHYWGEMITYLGMTLPMAVWSTVTWLKNPSKENGSEVAIQTLARRHLALLAASTVAVAAVFYYILKLLDTPNLFFSTVSIITSFLAAALTMLRSPTMPWATRRMTSCSSCYGSWRRWKIRPTSPWRSTSPSSCSTTSTAS